MRRREFLGLISLLGCKNEDMILPQQVAQSSLRSIINLLIVAGQSNAEKGVLDVSADLDPPYEGPFPEVQYYGEDLVFRDLDSTSQDNYQSPVNGVTDNYAFQFYLYPRIAAALGCTADNPLYVCSLSVGDTNLEDDWQSGGGGGALYNDLVSRINSCQTAIWDLRGHRVNALCMLWDQGEKDGRVLADANNYATNIANFMTGIRTACVLPDLRFCFPLINQMAINAAVNPVTFAAGVNNAKRNAEVATPTKVITTDSNNCEPSSDSIHYTVTGQFDKSTLVLQRMIDAGWLQGTLSPALPTDQTYFTGYNKRVDFGDILDSLFAAATSWRIGVTVYNPARYGLRTLISKFATTGSQRSFHWYHNGDAIHFNFYMTVGTGANTRGIQWTGLLAVLYDGNEHDLEIRYNGTVNTNNGLDRADLYIDGALYTTGKNLASVVGSLGTIFNSSALLAFGMIVRTGGIADSTNFWYDGYAREFFVQDGSAVDQVRVPNLLTGTDTSGNGNDGTYI